ncbi:MAG: transcriptional regulator [Burkholderiaceae bacterium]|nr:transcriptional regulator [Microbacteriaceae bacterium]
MPFVDSVSELSARLARAHERVISDGRSTGGVRQVVQESWERSLQLRLDPSTASPELALDDDDLREYRRSHPLSLVLPVVHRLLTRHAVDSGLIVAVGDAGGRLLWIDGDRALKRRAEEMMFVEGADWSESRVGTSAPGTALALDHGIQIQRAEHFNPVVHPWSCTAVPVHDPDSGAVIGVIDITGGDEAVAPHTLPLIEAAVAAVEAEMRIQRLDSAARRPAQRESARPTAIAPALHTLGRDHGTLEYQGRSIELSPRHAEIMTILAWHPDGLTAERLAELVYESEGANVTLRAEMVRLRKAIDAFAPKLTPLSRPYRLARPVDLDAHRVLAFLERGAHRVALAAYQGPVLPASAAPGIVGIRGEVRTRLRDALLTDASVETLLGYARTDEAAYDTEVWKACLSLLPPRSPKRAGVVSRIEHIEAEVGAR